MLAWMVFTSETKVSDCLQSCFCSDYLQHMYQIPICLSRFGKIYSLTRISYLSRKKFISKNHIDMMNCLIWTGQNQKQRRIWESSPCVCKRLEVCGSRSCPRCIPIVRWWEPPISGNDTYSDLLLKKNLIWWWILSRSWKRKKVDEIQQKRFVRTI